MMRSYQISTTNKSNGDAKEKRQFKFNSDVAGLQALETVPPSLGPFSGGSGLAAGGPPVCVCLIIGCLGGV